jgi:hypothetical protein
MTFVVDGTNGLTFNDATTQSSTATNASNISSGTLGKARLPTGSVLQVVNGTTTTTASTSSTSVIDTNLTATITPTSSTSKILVLVSQRVYKNQTCSGGANIFLQRGATNLLTDQRVGLNDTSSVGNDQTWSCCYLDSPTTTSATTYKTQFANQSGNGTVYVNLDGNQAQITLMEIAA